MFRLSCDSAFGRDAIARKLHTSEASDHYDSCGRLGNCRVCRAHPRDILKRIDHVVPVVGLINRRPIRIEPPGSMGGAAFLSTDGRPATRLPQESEIIDHYVELTCRRGCALIIPARIVVYGQENERKFADSARPRRRCLKGRATAGG
jgi:hypothetical protein